MNIKRKASMLQLGVFIFLCLLLSCNESSGPISVKEIELSPTAIVMKAGESAAIEAAVLPDNATDKSILWTSSDPDMVSIAEGTVNVSSEATAGEYIITVSSVSDPDITASCVITVEASASTGGGGGGGTTTEEQPKSITLQDTDSLASYYEIKSDDEQFSVGGLTSGELYSIYPESMDSNQNAVSLFSAKRAMRANTQNQLFHEKGLSSYLYIPPVDFDNLVFSAKDIGLKIGDRFRIAKVATTPNQEFLDGNTSMVLHETEDKMLYTTADGLNVYEKFYKVDLNKIKGIDPSRVVVVIQNKGSAEMKNSNYGLLGSNGEQLTDAYTRGVMDLSEYESVYLYNRMEVKGTDPKENPCIQTILMLSPEILNVGESATMKAPAIYQVEPSNSELILEITGDDVNQLAITNANANGRIAFGNKAGYHHPYIFPIIKEQNRIVVYIGQVTESIIFDFVQDVLNGDAEYQGTLRAITEEEKATIEYIRQTEEEPTSSLPLTLNVGDYIPIIFEPKDNETKSTISIENNADNVSLYAVASHTSGEGYSGKSMSEQSIGFSEYEILEYAFLEYYGNEDGKEITIKIDW